MKHLKVCFVVLASLFTFLTFNVNAFSQSKATSPETIVKNMADRYAALSSYADSGVVETVSNDPLPRRSTDIGFKTHFTRPNKLRFEWLAFTSFSTDERSVVWSDGAKTFSFYSFEPEQVKTKEDISLALAGATGISRGSAHTVPALLISDVGGFLLTELTKLSLKREEVFEGEECYVIEGHHPHGEPWQLWISKKDSLLRKVRSPSTDGDFQEQIHRDIKVDDKIPEAIYQPKVAGGRIAADIAKEKEADIRRLLEMIVPRDKTNHQLAEVREMLKKTIPQVPEKTWQEVLSETGIDTNMMLEIYVPIYDWHYSGDEIKQLIRLYESPLGLKMVRSAEHIESEATQRVTHRVEELIKRIQEKLRAKGYKVDAE